jgi:hypothetical protein
MQLKQLPLSLIDLSMSSTPQIAKIRIAPIPAILIHTIVLVMTPIAPTKVILILMLMQRKVLVIRTLTPMQTTVMIPTARILHIHMLPLSLTLESARSCTGLADPFTPNDWYHS